MLDVIYYDVSGKWWVTNKEFGIKDIEPTSNVRLKFYFGDTTFDVLSATKHMKKKESFIIFPQAFSIIASILDKLYW